MKTLTLTQLRVLGKGMLTKRRPKGLASRRAPRERMLTKRGNVHQDTREFDEDRNIKFSERTVNASGVGSFSLGDINDTVVNTISHLPTLTTRVSKNC